MTANAEATDIADVFEAPGLTPVQHMISYSHIEDLAPLSSDQSCRRNSKMLTFPGTVGRASFVSAAPQIVLSGRNLITICKGDHCGKRPKH
jgi:hypothetical protein